MAGVSVPPPRMTLENEKRLRRTITGYRIWTSVLLLYVLGMQSYFLTERNEMWGQWQRTWQAAYKLRQAAFETEMRGAWEAWVTAHSPAPERRKFTTPMFKK